MKKMYRYAICEFKDKPIEFLRWGAVSALTQKQAVKKIKKYYKEKKNYKLKNSMDILVWYDKGFPQDVVEIH
jgi:hypothetical protein